MTAARKPVVLRPSKGRSYPMGRISALFKADGRTRRRVRSSSVPGVVTHDFENRGSARAGLLNFSVPGGFEADMPGIVQWFAENPPGEAG